MGETAVEWGSEEVDIGRPNKSVPAVSSRCILLGPWAGVEHWALRHQLVRTGDGLLPSDSNSPAPLACHWDRQEQALDTQEKLKVNKVDEMFGSQLTCWRS